MIFQLAIFWFWSNIFLSNEERFTFENYIEEPEKSVLVKESEYLETILFVTAVYLLIYEMCSKNNLQLDFNNNVQTLFRMLPNILLLISVYYIENTTYFWDL